MTDTPKLTLRKLAFTGPEAEVADLTFQPGLNLLWGGSNTGKSFAVKSVAFMLAASNRLPQIDEHIGYDRVWLSADLAEEQLTLMRALAGGAYVQYSGYHTAPSQPHLVQRLNAKHDATNTRNLSQFLLTKLNIAGKKIATDVSGNTKALGFRDLIRYCIVDETAIQSERSPIDSGQYQFETEDRSVFKLLVSGLDDSAIVPVISDKAFKASKTAKLEIVQEMLTEIQEELDANFPDMNDLPSQGERIENTLLNLQNEFDAAQSSVRQKLAIKTQAVRQLEERKQREGEIALNISRFQKLDEIYVSDTARLDALEEVSFLLLAGGEQPCPLCGSLPGGQLHGHALPTVEASRKAALAEIAKINALRRDLKLTLDSLTEQRQENAKEVERFDNELTSVENELKALMPETDQLRRQLQEVLPIRDTVKRGLALLQQRDDLMQRVGQLSAKRAVNKSDRPQLGVSSTIAYDFAQVVSQVLEKWKFPGKRHVAFDEKTYDLQIDGKHRKDNGKGVRAITHAAFQVALMMFCHERGLPHPGFLILDTPLLTYRDPVRSKAGALTPDELQLKSSPLREAFFEHLGSLSNIGQFIIVENVDPPIGIEKIANVQLFTGDPSVGRAGLFPIS
jgi:hypothetical protein